MSSKRSATKAEAVSGRNPGAKAAYALTILLAAFLLFLIQPLICKFVLPWFGGASNVWTTCMLFFQVALFGGYVYAHLLSTRLQPWVASLVHLALVLAALASLSITPSAHWKPAGDANPTWRILALLTCTVGLPYFVLAGTGPLVQRWLSQDLPGIQTFRLYALSNAGSLVALLGFPFFLETHLPSGQQATLWSLGFLAYAVGCAICGARLWKRRSAVAALESSHKSGPTNPKATKEDKLLWFALPACASLLLLATTNKICQEVAVVPLLWVIPLSLYLLSFIICFDNPRWYLRLPYGLALAAAMFGMCFVLQHGAGLSLAAQIGIYCTGLFVACLVCHGELYRLRPGAGELTGFYLIIAAGGAAGSLLVAVIAPLVFRGYFEFHWGLVGCAGLFLLIFLRRRESPRWQRQLFGAGFALGWAALCVALWRQSHRLEDAMVHRVRNFYGVISVVRVAGADKASECLGLVHGRTMHGLQFTAPERAAVPTLYYSENSGVALALRALPQSPRRIGLVGLGAGTLATYARPGDVIKVYELDPEVVHLAESNFTFLKNCRGKVHCSVGDARLELEREPPQRFDLLALDAFSDDTVPVHLLTREAFEIYLRHVQPAGIIAVHASSASVNLEPVLANLAHHFHLIMSVIDQDNYGKSWIAPSIWILLARTGEIIESPAIRWAARPPQTNSSNVRLWTDDFTGLAQILRKDPGADTDREFSERETAVAQKLFGTGDFRGCLAAYRSALGRHPNAPLLLNNFGFLLATCPDAALRNAAEAAEMTERACQLTRYRSAIFVSTLAAVYSETGRFPEAVAMQEKACALDAESRPAALELDRGILELYRMARPLHEFGKPPPE